MKRTAQIALLLVAVLVTLLTACAKQDKVVGIGDDDLEMPAAIAKARQTLPQFWQVFDKREQGEIQKRTSLASPNISGNQGSPGRSPSRQLQYFLHKVCFTSKE
jgi:predicted small secreted protein